jgi:hypothetical protein
MLRAFFQAYLPILWTVAHRCIWQFSYDTKLTKRRVAAYDNLVWRVFAVRLADAEGRLKSTALLGRGTHSHAAKFEFTFRLSATHLPLLSITLASSPYLSSHARTIYSLGRPAARIAKSGGRLFHSELPALLASGSCGGVVGARRWGGLAAGAFLTRTRLRYAQPHRH